MGTPAGTRCVRLAVADGDAVHVYSGKDGIVLQLRRDVPTQTELCSPSFKVAVRLAPAEVLKLAAELLTAASLLMTAK